MRTIFTLLLFLSSSLSALTYDAEIKTDGTDDNKIIESLKRASTTFQMKAAPPVSFAALKRRAERDIEKQKAVLWASGYFSCEIAVQTIFEEPQPKVVFSINKGPRYSYGKIQVLPIESPVRIKTGEFVRAEEIEEAKREILSDLRSKGYPLATIQKSTLWADRKEATLDVTFDVLAGPYCLFGPIHIAPTAGVDEEFFTSLCPWSPGDKFSSSSIEEMQRRLEKSGLFKTVTIKEGPLENGKVPIEISAEEALQKTIGAGLSYTTTYGPGVSLLWNHRNVARRGQRFDFRADLWEHDRAVTLRYTTPNFLKYKQNLIYLLEYDFTTTISYVSSAVKASVLLETALSKELDIVRGLQFERLTSHGFDGNDLFRIAKLPFQARWSSANSLLDPTMGAIFNCKLTPAFQLAGKPYPYLIHSSSLTGYYSFFEDGLTLAAKAQMANIFGEAEDVIPLPDRLFGGSDNSFRGYKSLSVAPLNRHNIPVGGRSMLSGTLEARIRTSSSLGYVLFYDVGNVYLHWLPQIHKPYLHSTGFGIRYKTPIGPLRLDLAFPLNRRPNIDPPFQIYFSIGQSF